MENKKTSMQQHIDGLKILLSAAKYQPKDTEHWSGYISAITAAIRLAEANLSVEREQMEKASKEGNLITYLSMSNFVSFDDYFNNTYTQE